MEDLRVTRGWKQRNMYDPLNAAAKELGVEKDYRFDRVHIRRWIGGVAPRESKVLQIIALGWKVPVRVVAQKTEAQRTWRYQQRLNGQAEEEAARARTTAAPPTSSQAVVASPPFVQPAEPAASVGDVLAVGEIVLPPRAIGLPSLQQLELLRRRLNNTLSDGNTSEAILRDWEQTILDHGRATRDHPPGVLLADLAADLDQLTRDIANCRSTAAMRRLTRVAAQMSGLMCLTLVKLDERDGFRSWARMARIAAQEIGDPATYSWVRAQEAYGHYYAGDLALAIQVAHDAQESSGPKPQVGASLAAALEARAQAALGDERATRAALDRAESILARLQADAHVPSAFGYTESQLRFHEGSAYTHLHDTAAAWRAQERALALCPPDDYTDRGLTQLDRATCLAHDGDISGATTYALQALDGLTQEQRRGIITMRAHGIVAALPAHVEALPATRDLRELITVATDKEDEAS